MKNKIKITFLSIIGLFIIASCSSPKKLSNSKLKKLDIELVGTWAGSETGVQLEDTKREWEMIRNSDGTFILKFKTYHSNHTSESVQKGIWWTINGKFYEHHTGYETDVYKYDVLNENEIKFTAIKIRAYFEGDTYEFIDKRKE